MKSFILKRRYFFPAALCLALAFGGGAMYVILKNAYESYWLVIYRVQTADFNILSSTAPGTISGVIEEGDMQKAMEIASSNFCLFRVTITKCEDSECTERKLLADNVNATYKRCMFLSELKKPEIEVPIFKDKNSLATTYYTDTYSTEHKAKSYKDQPVGFLNLYRGKPIPFVEDISLFFNLWIKGEANASRHHIYKNATYLSLFIGIVVFMVGFSFRLIYISEFKRKALTRKLVRFIESR